MFCFLYHLDWPNLIIGALLGGLVGFILVILFDKLRQPKFNYTGFSLDSNGIYKLDFILKRKYKNIDPFSLGVCCCEIKKENGEIHYAKWDETPNPTKFYKNDGNIPRFIPEMVPATYHLNLFVNKKYSIPILIKKNNDYLIFDGWYFGKSEGYYNDTPINVNEKIEIIIRGNSPICNYKFTLTSIINATKIV